MTDRAYDVALSLALMRHAHCGVMPGLYDGHTQRKIRAAWIDDAIRRAKGSRAWIGLRAAEPQAAADMIADLVYGCAI